MRPALSIVLFTTASGAGYGMLAWLGLLGAAGLLPAAPLFGFVVFAIAVALVSIGLIASTFHLGHPERAWRAFSQWRSSWLSREGVAAVVTFVPIAVYGGGWVLAETIWPAAGLLTTAMALVTVYCTSMIYGSLKTVPAWHNNRVPPAYLVLALASGGVWLTAVAACFAAVPAALLWLSLLALAAGLAVKLGYWRHIDAPTSDSTAETATGLGRIGAVRPLLSPHSAGNWVLREMGYQVARRHARTLRRITVVLGFAVPLAMLAFMLAAGEANPWLAVAAALALSAGFAAERWLFFAEAKHVVTLFYGDQR
jgi:DMSO reductase anchor subunit